MRVKEIYNQLLNLIFPPKCIFCDKILDYTESMDICEMCLGETVFLTDEEKNHFSYILNKDNICDDGICFFKYDGVIKKSIIDYKFKDRPSNYRGYVYLIKNDLQKFFNKNDIDIILPVPLHKRREADRGYNQAGYIAKEIAKIYGKEYKANIIKRVKNTKAQSGLNKTDRDINIGNAFKVEWEEYIKNKNVLLVDDVITTGGTVKECCKILKENGANRVYLLTIATGKRI